MSGASESEPLPLFLSHLRGSAIEVEPRGRPSTPERRAGKQASRQAVLEDGRVTCSAAMLRWSTSSWPSQDRSRPITATTNWLRSDDRRVPAIVKILAAITEPPRSATYLWLRSDGTGHQIRACQCRRSEWHRTGPSRSPRRGPRAILRRPQLVTPNSCRAVVICAARRKEVAEPVLGCRWKEDRT